MASRPRVRSYIAFSSTHEQEMEVSESVGGPDPSKKEKPVFSKLRNRLSLLRKAQVRLFWARGMPVIALSVSSKAEPSNTTVGNSPTNSIASAAPPNIARAAALKRLIGEASTSFPSRRPSLNTAKGTSTSTATPTVTPAKNGFKNVSACRTRKTETKFFDFTEPLPCNDHLSLMSVVLTPTSHQPTEKKLRFIPGLKDNEYMEMNCSTVIEFPDGSEELKTLISDLRGFANVILHLDSEVLSNIAWSLPSPMDEALSNLSLELRSHAFEYRPPCDPQSELQRFLRCLDAQTHQRFLCRDCDKFHARGLRYKNPTWPTPSTSECATQFIIGNNEHHGRLFKQPFRFSELQLAMKFYKHSLNYHRFLRPFNFSATLPEKDLKYKNNSGVLCQHTTNKPFFHSINHIWTSDTYVESDRLLSRIQHFYHTSPTSFPPSRAEFRVFCKTVRNHGGVTNLCRHLMDRCQTPKKRGGFTLWDFENQDNNPRVRRCEDCALEYRYDWYDVGELGSGLVLSVWRDFGCCLSAFDPRFLAHFEEFEGRGFRERFKGGLSGGGGRWKGDVKSKESDWAVGDIQKVFEAKGGFDLEECVAGVEGRFRDLVKPRREESKGKSASAS